MAKIKNPLPITVEWKGTNRREVYLDYLVKANNWKVGAEVGVRIGRTLFYLLEQNLELRMYAIDRDIKQFNNGPRFEAVKDRIIILEGTSWIVHNQINELLDFVFIDAGHSAKSVVKDINSYKPLLKTKKGLTGHDVDFPSVQAALQKCEIEYDVGPNNIWLQK